MLSLGWTSRSSARSPALLADAAIEPTSADNRESSTAASSCSCSTISRPAPARRGSSGGEAVHRALPRRQRHRRHRPDRRPQGRRQEFTSSRACCSGRSTISSARRSGRRRSTRSTTTTGSARREPSCDGSARPQRAGPLDFERAYKARNTFTMLKNVSDYLSGMRGRRKAVVFFSEGIDYDINDIDRTPLRVRRCATRCRTRSPRRRAPT